MRNPLMTALSLLCCAICLTACAEALPPVHYKTVVAQIPEQLLICGVEPGAPAATKQSQVAGYIVDLRAWGQGCQSNLAQIRVTQGK